MEERYEPVTGEVDVKPGRGKGKGSAFEIKVSKFLTRWASGKEKPLWYWKSSGSGSQATITRDHKSKMVGDIMAITEGGQFLTDVFVIECKDRRTGNVLDFLKPKPTDSDILGWWIKVCSQAKKADRKPMLFFHRYQSKYDYVVVDKTFWTEYIEWVGNDSYDYKALTTGPMKNALPAIVFEVGLFFSIVSPWELAYTFLGDEVGRSVEENFCKP